MRKNPHDGILKMEHKEQHLSTVLKSCPFIKIDPRRYFQTLIKIYLSTFVNFFDKNKSVKYFSIIN